MVRSESGTVVVNSEANTLVDSELGTMVINDTDDEESTMKRAFFKNFHILQHIITCNLCREISEIGDINQFAA